MVKYVYVNTIEENYSNWIAIYEGTIEKDGEFNNSKLPIYFKTSKCVFRKESNGKLNNEIKQLINYGWYQKDNISIIYQYNEFNSKLICEAKIIDKEQIDNIIRTYENCEEKNSCDYIKNKIIELFEHRKNVGQYTNEFLDLNQKIFGNSILNLSLSEKEECSNLLLSEYEKFKQEKLNEAKKINNKVCIYSEIGLKSYGERGYKYKKEYIFPDEHIEKCEGYTNG